MNSYIFLLRVLGVLCVLGASLLCGLMFCIRYEHKYDEYEGLKHILLKILRNQEYLNRSFPELFTEGASELEKNMYKGAVMIHSTQVLGKSIPDIPFETAWRQYIDEISLHLKMNEELRNQLMRLGSALQEMDKEGICFQIQTSLDYLQEVLNESRRALKDKKKVSMACSFMVGMFTVILLI